MTQTTAKLKVRSDRKQAKRQQKKDMIAKSALIALCELGYANTSLRDIAANCDLSLGMLHYYFEDKDALILHCVRLHKQRFFDQVRSTYEREPNLKSFYAALVDALLSGWKTHRLWYDMRSQAMFTSELQPIVRELEDQLIELVKMAYGNNISDADAYHVYTLLDGVFSNHVHALSMGRHFEADDVTEAFGKIRFAV